MSILSELILTLKASTSGVGVYSSVIPEAAPVPAIALQNIAFISGRVLNGDKTGRWSQWRITAVATVQGLQDLIDQLELLDNTSNQYFRKMFVDLTLVEPKGSTEPHQRAFIDVRVYK